MSTFPGLTAVIEAELARFNIRAASQYELADAIARSVVEFATTDDRVLRADYARVYQGSHRSAIPPFAESAAALGPNTTAKIIADMRAGIRAALGEENADG